MTKRERESIGDMHLAAKLLVDAIERYYKNGQVSEADTLERVKGLAGDITWIASDLHRAAKGDQA